MGIWLSTAWAVGLIVLGIGGLLAPVPFGRVFGSPERELASRLFIRATAARDLALGVALAGLIRSGNRQGLAILLGASVLVPLSDFVLVWAHGQGLRWSRWLHLLGAAVMASTSALVISGR